MARNPRGMLEYLRIIVTLGALIPPFRARAFLRDPAAEAGPVVAEAEVAKAVANVPQELTKEGDEQLNPLKVAGQSLITHLVRNVKANLLKQERDKRDLAFVHVPMTFGQTIERAALFGRSPPLPGIVGHALAAGTDEQSWSRARSVAANRGEIWGHMNPDLRAISNATGCSLFHTPQKLWPDDFASRYFGGRRPFGLVRDPYDRLVAEFRQQASGGGRVEGELTRQEVSEREGSIEREGAEYEEFFKMCDVNRWAKMELKRYKAGDKFRGNCHLLPQAEFFEHPTGISLPIDARTIPDSFNVEMDRHGYPFRMDLGNIEPAGACPKISAFSLDSEAKDLVKEVYAQDFDLLCRHFGYCDRDKLTCMSQLQFMCAGMTKGRPLKHRGTAASISDASAIPEDTGAELSPAM